MIKSGKEVGFCGTGKRPWFSDGNIRFQDLKIGVFTC